MGDLYPYCRDDAIMLEIGSEVELAGTDVPFDESPGVGKRLGAWIRVKLTSDVGILVIYYAGTYDPLNIGGGDCLEVCARRIMKIADAYRAFDAQPCMDLAPYLGGVHAGLRGAAIRRQRADTEDVNARSRARDTRGPGRDAEAGRVEIDEGSPSKTCALEPLWTLR